MKKIIFSRNNIEVKSSPIHGLGVFATKDISPNEIVEECPVIIVDEAGEHRENTTTLFDRKFSWNKKQSAIALGYGSLYNHSKKFSAEFFLDHKNNLIKIAATKPILAGEEILIDYGKNYFNYRKELKDFNDVKDKRGLTKITFLFVFLIIMFFSFPMHSSVIFKQKENTPNNLTAEKTI